MEETHSNLFRTLAQAVEDGHKQPRSYNGTNTYKPSYARFKMKIWYKDGNSRVYYSFDYYHTPNQSARTDEYEGLKKLIRLAHVHHVENVKVCVIWATAAAEPSTALNHYDYEIFKVTKSGFKENKNVAFRKVNQINIILDAARLFYSRKKL